jgi:hypothetical protein
VNARTTEARSTLCFRAVCQLPDERAEARAQFNQRTPSGERSPGLPAATHDA